MGYLWDGSGGGTVVCLYYHHCYCYACQRTPRSPSSRHKDPLLYMMAFLADLELLVKTYKNHTTRTAYVIHKSNEGSIPFEPGKQLHSVHSMKWEGSRVQLQKFWKKDLENSPFHRQGRTKRHPLENATEQCSLRTTSM